MGLKGGWWEMFLKGRFELYYFHISDLHSCLAGMFGEGFVDSGGYCDGMGGNVNWGWDNGKN